MIEKTNDVMIEKTSDEKYEKRQKRLRVCSLIFSHFIVILMAAFIVVPLYVVIITSLKTSAEANGTIFRWWPKEGFSLDGYIKIFTTKQENRDLIRAFGVTLWMYVPSITVGVLVSALAAYGFAKVDFFLKKPIFFILLNSLTLPNSVGMIAAIVIYNGIGWMGTPLPLMIPRMFGSIGIVFFMRQFYVKLPDDLIDAGKIDGLGFFGVFNRIIFPMSGTVIVAQFILTFISAYNDYLGPLLFCQSASMYTLQVALAMFAGPYAQNWPLRMAGAFVGMAPLIIMYVAMQKYIRKGLAISSSVKG